MKIRKTLTPSSSKTVLAMVGLPARGKSFISYRTALFFNWIGVSTRVFNVGNKRRVEETADQSAGYFDPNNEEAKASRERLAEETLMELLEWLDTQSTAVAIFDATNSTIDRRRRVQSLVSQHNSEYSVVFIETRCNDEIMIEANVKAKVSRSPDYVGMDYEVARRDFYSRMDMYRRAFEAIGDDPEEEDLSFIKMLNLSAHVVVHKVYGRMTTNLLPYLMALHIGSRPVWLMRLPESATEAEGRSTVTFCDAEMSHGGIEFSQHFAKYVERQEEMSHCRIFVCTHRRGLDLSMMLDPLSERTHVHPLLNPMDWGAYEGIARRDFERKCDSKFVESFVRDPMNTRFPGGECYTDFVRRLQPVVVEIEQQLEPVIVIAPSSVVQVLHCYYASMPVSKASEVVIPRHSVEEWRPSGAGFVSYMLQKEEILAEDDIVLAGDELPE
jgi:6-phosphofructo-2-kinase/fructose-2,6-biphosphatase 2